MLADRLPPDTEVPGILARAMAFPAGRSCESAKVHLEHALLVERNHAEAFLAERVVPGAEVHHDRDVTWVVHDGQAWRNAGIMVRFSAAAAARRLDTLLARYKKHRRGMALWISPAATPDSLPELLQARGLRCQKYFPAMIRTLGNAPRSSKRAPAGLEIRPVTSLDEFEDIPYPAIGALTTPLRRVAFERLQQLLAAKNGGTRAFVAWLKGQPVGAIELFHGSETSGIHGLSVIGRFQGQGIASALLEEGCREARGAGLRDVVLLATTQGQHLYQRRGFSEAARFGYWYRSFQRSL
jgi:ribosomal protein S18 acetylase RimI-like enzyme